MHERSKAKAAECKVSELLEVLSVTARRERKWSSFSEAEKKLYAQASDEHWQKWLDNEAVEVILPGEADNIIKDLSVINSLG